MRWVEGGSIDGQERSRVGGGGREDPRREGRAGLHPDGDRGKISKARNRRNRAASLEDDTCGKNNSREVSVY